MGNKFGERKQKQNWQARYQDRVEGGPLHHPLLLPSPLLAFYFFSPVSQIYFPLSPTKEPGPRLSEFWPNHKLSEFFLTKITSKFYQDLIFCCIFVVVLYKIQHQKKKLPSVHVSFDNGANLESHENNCSQT